MTYRKIEFLIVKDSDGYPPFDVEGLWGRGTELPLNYVIDNIPLFARQATLGDTVRVRDEGDRLVFDQVVARSGSSLIRVVAYDPSRVDEIRAELKLLGCSSEAFKGRPIIAVDIPEHANLQKVQQYLTGLEEADVAGYEEPILRHPEP